MFPVHVILMSMKRGPIILILVLVFVLIFILGVQYGKKVNVADEALSLVMSITQTPAPTQSPQTNTTYLIYTDSICSVSFLYPNTLKLKNASTEAALVNSDQINELIITCIEDPTPTQERQENIATRSVELRQFSLVGENVEEVNEVFVRFSKKHPYNNRTVIVTVNENLLPLVEKTFEFVKP